jgi:DNA primase
MERQQAKEVKAAVSIEDLARQYTELKRQGANLVGLCPAHDEKTPSFTVYPDGHFYCYGCHHHGDVIDLYRAVEGGEFWEAVRALAEWFDVELPLRPESWRRWTVEKGERRDDIRRVRAGLYQRRIFKLFFAEQIGAIEDAAEREEEADKVWRELWPVCWRWAA